ncbi:MAG: hypothetical protein GY913_26370 [Proteobacteria bacterium]|nr:hypothetical protein [Pseudomonadota bacterium]MCP4920442.1 hypothetical protein [Pseudomonadota bacterium]
MLALLLACSSPKSAPKTTPPVSNDSPVQSEDTGVDSIDDYVQAYCTDYAVPCGVYADVEACSSVLYEGWFDSCELADVDALQTCISWIRELSCDDEGWIDECSEAFECD